MTTLFRTDTEDKNRWEKIQILKYCIANGNSTIVDLTRHLGLSIPTTTKIINEMLGEGMLAEYGKLETTEGRRPTLYGINPKSGYFIGVDILHFSLNIAMIDFRGESIAQEMHIPYRFANDQKALDELCRHISEFIDKQDEALRANILSVNVNISGRVNPQTGYSHSIFNFVEGPLDHYIGEKIGYETHINNDTRAMAYGEYLQGCVDGEKNVLFINLSWGLGMGIIINGDIYGGKSGFAGEIGHVRAFNNEIICHCGKKGCLETEVSGLAFHRIAKERIESGESSILATKFPKLDFTIDDLIDAALNEDMLCIEILEEIGSKLGMAVSGFINIFNPDLVIVGGELSRAANYIMQPMKTSMHKFALNLLIKDTNIKLSELKDRAGMVGACLLARRALFE